MPESRYIRQELFEPIGTEGQRRIMAASAVIVGCGALGTNIANNLARSGVGRLRIIDRDLVEMDNLQRQVLFDEEDVRRRMPKAVAAVRRLAAVNSEIALEAEVRELSSANIERLLDGCDVVMDGTDNAETRLLLNDACVKAGTPYVFGGVAGATGMTMAIVPGRTPCLRCFMPEPPAPGTAPTAATDGILHSVTATIAALECTSALRILTGSFDAPGVLVTVDVWEGEFERMEVAREPDCPACGRRQFEFLDAPPRPRAAPVRGTRCVRVPAREGEPVPLGALVDSWRGIGEVVANKWLASLTVGERELIVFADGRALVKGTGDVSEAERLVRRYVEAAGGAG